MLNLAAWYYRDLLDDNDLIEAPDFYKLSLLNGDVVYESNVRLKNKWRPTWLTTSQLYKDADGSGTDKYKNIAVYKAISEALERLAFYELVDNKNIDFSFDVNPSTTGMASFPYFNHSLARQNSIYEAVERWAIHSLNYSELPIKKIPIDQRNIEWYEILTPFTKVRVSLIQYKSSELCCYGFAGGKNLSHSFFKSLVELDRNYRVLKKMGKDNLVVNNFSSNVDRTLAFFSSEEGDQKFKELIDKSPRKILHTNPKIICDKPMIGMWNRYTKIWRYLIENSYYDRSQDYKFFMF